MIITAPCRLMTRHLSQRTLTDAETFTTRLSPPDHQANAALMPRGRTYGIGRELYQNRKLRLRRHQHTRRCDEGIADLGSR